VERSDQVRTEDEHRIVFEALGLVDSCERGTGGARTELFHQVHDLLHRSILLAEQLTGLVLVLDRGELPPEALRAGCAALCLIPSLEPRCELRCGPCLELPDEALEGVQEVREHPARALRPYVPKDRSEERGIVATDHHGVPEELRVLVVIPKCRYHAG